MVDSIGKEINVSLGGHDHNSGKGPSIFYEVGAGGIFFLGGGGMQKMASKGGHICVW